MKLLCRMFGHDWRANRAGRYVTNYWATCARCGIADLSWEPGKEPTLS